MKIIVEKDREALSDKVARILVDLVKNGEVKNIAFPTGNTVTFFYEKLVAFYKLGLINFLQITGFLLDEYYPIENKSEFNFRNYIDNNFCKYVNLKTMYYFNSENKDFLGECAQYKSSIFKEGGLDLTILGMGENGHIGFNEPGSEFNSKVRLVELKNTTIKSNTNKYDIKSYRLKYALTLGIYEIFKSKKILLLVSGKEKSVKLRDLIEGQIGTELPASILKVHPDVTLITDMDAACLIDKELLSIICGNQIE
jgi:glucosamine-6-phosphate deaminase